jgi:predicted DsbA family dithiol-disulfide isomerase
VKTVEIWSDILCPFCYIGKHRFQAAWQAFPQRDQVQVVWRSFELDPQAQVDYGVSMDELLAKKYGRDLNWAKEMNANIAGQGRALGLEIHSARIIPTNSFHAHRLLQLAQSLGLEDAVSEKLFRAYFSEGKHIGRIETLQAIAQEAGIDPARAEAVLTSDEFTAEVRRDEDMAQQLGLTGVPAFVIDRRYLISGAQPTEVFTEALQKIAGDAG